MSNLLVLKYVTPIDWATQAIAAIDLFLLDHASCEKKAATMALSMVSHYPDKPDIVSAMTALAVEEMIHFKQVVKRIQQRGLTLQSDTKDDYVLGLRKAMRGGKSPYLLDRLLVAAIVEARGYQRFSLIADNLPQDDELRAFYQEIAASEADHFTLFLKLAGQYCEEENMASRLDELLSIEAELISACPFRPALH